MAAVPRRRVRLSVGDVASGEGIVIESLRVDFDVEKINGAPHLATIKVFNLAPDTRRLLQDRYTRAVLEYGVSVGTPDVRMSVVFVGEVYNSITTRDGDADLVTTLYCGSGLRGRAEATISKTFAADVGLGDLVRSVAGELEQYGVQLGIVDDAIDDVPTTGVRGRVLSGAVTQVLDNLLEGTGFTFNIQGDSAEITRTMIDDEAEIVVTPASGLVGSARRTHQGYDFTSLLNPAIRPGMTVGVYSQLVQTSVPGLHYMQIASDTGARVRVLSVKHTGSNYEGAATTEVTGIR